MNFIGIGDKIKEHELSDHEYKYYEVCPPSNFRIHPAYKVSFALFIIDEKYIDMLIRC